MTPKGSSPEDQFFGAISKFREDGEFSDLILRHAAGSFKVHRIIVCPQSEVLHKACSGDFEEHSTGVIEMVEISYLELRKMVDFLYSMSYDDELETEQEAEDVFSLLQLHARMFALGDRYDIPTLRDIAVKKYISRVMVSWVPREFLESIYDVYGRTPPSIRQLRDAAAHLMRNNVQKLLKDAMVASVYDKVLDDIPEFTKDMLGVYVKAPLYGGSIRCGSNQAGEALQGRCKRCGKGLTAFGTCTT